MLVVLSALGLIKVGPGHLRLENNLLIYSPSLPFSKPATSITTLLQSNIFSPSISFCIFDTPRSFRISYHTSLIMRYSFISAAILALSSSILAQTSGFDAISSPTLDQNVPAGTSLDIVWQPSTSYTGTVTITLLEGATPNTLSLGAVVAGS
jgi:hypothetical protein